MVLVEMEVLVWRYVFVLEKRTCRQSFPHGEHSRKVVYKIVSFMKSSGFVKG